MSLNKPVIPEEWKSKDTLKPNKPKKPANTILSVILALVICYVVYTIAMPFVSGKIAEIPTSEFLSALDKDNITDVTYRPSDGTLRGHFFKDGEGKPDKTKAVPFSSTYVGSDHLAEVMSKHSNVTYEVDTSDAGFMKEVLLYAVPIVLLIGGFIFVVNKFGPGQAQRFTKTNAKSFTRPDVRFSDVAGIDEALEELEEVKDFLVNPKRYQKMGAKIPHGVLLVGPPGTGKTLLAKAIAGEAKVPFFTISGSEFLEMFVGVGASRVRDLFAQAKQSSPSIIFIDEIDAIGRQRGAGLGGSHDEREQTLNQLLVEMDGFNDSSSVILLAATNRPDILDPALLRPGRFDRQITVGRPDVKGREKILKVHSKNKPLAEGISFEKLAKLTPGFTGADLANFMNEAALLAARHHKSEIDMPEIEEAMERSIAGPQLKSRVMTEKERKIIAYHESGHALVGHLLEDADPVHKISIISRGQALGYTLSLPEEDRFLSSRQSMLDQITTLLAGRCAEEIFCDDITTGASNDLERATKIARQMVMRLGMTDLGVQVYGEAQHEVFLGRDFADKQDFSDATALRIDNEVNRIITEAHELAIKLLTDHADRMHTMARVLLERETVEGEAVDALLDGKWDEFTAAHPEYLVPPVKKTADQSVDESKDELESKCEFTADGDTSAQKDEPKTEGSSHEQQINN